MSADSAILTRRFPNDSVEGFNPVGFALRFVREMRRTPGLHHVPSLRTTLSIPRFLAARWFRQQRLDAADYIRAAVLNTPDEDQAIAERIARKILFPPKLAAGDKTQRKQQDTAAQTTGTPPAPSVDDMLADLAALNIDLDALDSLDELFEQDEADALGAFALFEQWLSGSDPVERALAELMSLFGGPGTLEMHGAHDPAGIRERLGQMLDGSAGAWSPQHLEHGCAAGFGATMARSAHLPWELAGAMAGSGEQQRLNDHLAALAASATPDVLGRTLRFMRPFAHRVDPHALEQVRAAAIARARDLGDWAALLDGLGEWIAPPPELVAASGQGDIERALSAAAQIARAFGHDLSCAAFDAWADTRRDNPPDLIELAQTSARCPRWEQLLDAAYQRLLDAIATALHSGVEAELLLVRAVHSVRSMRAHGNALANQSATVLVTDVLCLFRDPVAFLDTLDRFLAERVHPAEQERLIRHGVEIGVPRDEIDRRLGDALDQLKRLVEANVRDPAAYGRLLLRLHALPLELVESLTSKAVADDNREAIAVLLALDLAETATACGDDELVVECIGYKGIGGGSNLLQQWYLNGQMLSGVLRARIKALAKSALLELAMDWASRAGGSLNEGMIPQNDTRPLRASDDLDLLDIEGTIEALISEGRRPESLSDADLIVHDSARGRASFGVLIDISGSMAGEELAICCTAVLMLLGRLKPEEIAIALFESDTHAIKTFEEETDLDQVADELLDLRATGGTRADMALSWMREQFAGRDESSVQLLFLFSDFCFFETTEELTRHAQGLAELDVQLLAASHGFTNPHTRDAMLAHLSGDVVALSAVSELPVILNQAIDQVGKR